MRPRLLRPDNFTPACRTPWGGRRILDQYKRGLSLGEAGRVPVCGESWEISVEPSFPSRFGDDDARLGDAIRAAPAAWLGRDSTCRGDNQTRLLIKLLDARDNLSVQVHPTDDDPALAAGESGKVEAWYVLDAEPGSGIYLGFRDGVARGDVEQCLRRGGHLDQFMNFVPVTAGDAFVIPPGTVHAVGAGLTLLEPQSITPGCCGATYRYWDWQRRYDRAGRLSPTGRPRPLHIERALAVTRWDGRRGDAFVAGCRSTPESLTDGAFSRTVIVACSQFILERWSGCGILDIPAIGTLLAVVCVAGSAHVRHARGAVAIRRGQSMVIPAATGDIQVMSGDEPVALLVTAAPAA
ncbi:MAG: class I mannose-6-phosphate isomerase [Proteobacteria bacterium]|nr:class I mannose-6-phosphate isomerase [Pseudomonadota bacterium]